MCKGGLVELLMMLAKPVASICVWTCIMYLPVFLSRLIQYIQFNKGSETFGSINIINM